MQHQQRPGDWTCPSCGANVFASKSSCFKARESPPSLLQHELSPIPCTHSAGRRRRAAGVGAATATAAATEGAMVEGEVMEEAEGCVYTLPPS
jgi:hypothetical protein